MNEEESGRIASAISKLRQERDQLKLRLHLAGKEAQDQFAALEEKLAALEDRTEPLSGAVKEAASAAGEQARKVTGAALDLTVKELKAGYDKLRAKLDD